MLQTAQPDIFGRVLFLFAASYFLSCVKSIILQYCFNINMPFFTFLRCYSIIVFDDCFNKNEAKEL